MSEYRQPLSQDLEAARMRAMALLAELDRVEAEIQEKRTELVAAQTMLIVAKAERNPPESTRPE